MNHIELKGTHRQAGQQLGTLLWEQGVSILEQLPFAITSERMEYAEACIPIYQTCYPEILAELEGLAEGQRCDVHLLQAVLFSTYAMPPSCNCSCFAVTGHEILFGRNSDFLTALEQANTNVLYRLSDGAYALNGNTTSFLQMEDGVNQYGLAAGLTSVYPMVRKAGFNAGLLVRYVLEKCRTVSEALRCLEQLPTGSAQTITLADATGDLAVVESDAEHLAVIRPEQKDRAFVCATNVFHSAAMQSQQLPEEDNWFAETRYQTMLRALSSQANDWTLSFAKRLLSGGYGFICQYDRSSGKDTVWSVVYDLGQRSIYRSEGNPARCGYRQDTRPLR